MKEKKTLSYTKVVDFIRFGNLFPFTISIIYLQKCSLQEQVYLTLSIA